MNKFLKLPVLLFLVISINTLAQNPMPTGYPDRTSGFDVLPGFINTPKGYGEVPFYWWQGDTLTRERLLWQLNQLQDKGISSLQINYSHKDSGGLLYGLSNPSKPALFSPEWWNLFKWFASEAQKRNMTVSLSDYTLGIGQGFSMDEALSNNPELNGSLLKCNTEYLKGNVTRQMPDNLLTLTAIRIKEDSTLIAGTRKDLLSYVKDGHFNYNFGDETWKITAVYFQRLIPSYDPMHPLSGESYNRYFFDKFEKALESNGSGKLNFFFSDELNFRINGNIWDIYFANEFRKRKGYDILPFLDALYTDIGDKTSKIRLDYNDVVVSLSEENFFRPVYQWHQDRGLIFGCDHGGRGKDVTEFGDYFRTQRWNQGPGSDQPYLSKDIIKAKVASSIAHLYERPRVWLEGFHSSGWGTSSADVTDAIFANFIAGYNLLSFHGLYYSTMGGWWEWAPPCNHFRMPYWKHIDPLMKCIERLSYLLSQGYHNCDVAIMYPTESVVSGMNGDKSAGIAFSTGEKLYDKGIDFDFIDYESISRSEIKNGELSVSGERYKVLIIPSMKAIRFASLEKIRDFMKAGGIVVNIGDIPVATEKNGANDPETDRIISEIFVSNKGLITCTKPDEVPLAISGKYEAGFRVLTDISKRPYVIHRIVGKRDIYALYNLPSGTKCFFRAKGNVQLWDPWNGEIASLSEFATETGTGTEVELPLSEKEIQIIVFDPEKSDCEKIIHRTRVVKEIPIGNTWQFELKPSLDNQWGDFRLPATNELLGAQVNRLFFTDNKSGKKNTADTVTCGYGPRFLKLGALSEMPAIKDLIKLSPVKAGEKIILSGKEYFWREYAFSWQYGVEGDFGHQGYHGLKGEMYDNFIRLGAIKEVKMSKKRVSEPDGNYYLLFTSVIAPENGFYDLLTGEKKPSVVLVNNKENDPKNEKVELKKGKNTLLLVYNSACETYLVFRRPEIPIPARQPVSMIWYRDYGMLPFDYYIPNPNSGIFTFRSAPALKSFTFCAYGDVDVLADGKKAELIPEKKEPDGLVYYTAILKKTKPEGSNVMLKIMFRPGYYGAAAIPQDIKQKCGSGTIKTGDWSETDGLKAYSGGAWYRNTFNVSKSDLKKKLEIDLGDVVSSAEVFINGKSAGIRLSPPWNFDITKYTNEGRNKIEILIYNTLANNYVAIPTRYRGKIKSGLIGPVKLKISEQDKSGFFE